MYACEYRVRPQEETRFRETYGPGGRWVRLFRRGSGHVETTLYHDRSDPGRYVTVDRWASEDAFRAFRRDFAAEFEALDAECESMTIGETAFGEFDEICP